MCDWCHDTVTVRANYGDVTVTDLVEVGDMGRGTNVQINVLGPITVLDGHHEVALSPQSKRLLGLLVVAQGTVVSSDRIAEYVADGRVDGSTVRTAVSRLRKVLGERIESSGDGYRLVADAASWMLFVSRSWSIVFVQRRWRRASAGCRRRSSCVVAGRWVSWRMRCGRVVGWLGSTV